MLAVASRDDRWRRDRLRLSEQRVVLLLLLYGANVSLDQNTKGRQPTNP
jgi:hypothetical protein